MITYIWSMLLLSWLLLRCNYVHFFDHLLVHFFGHSYWHILDINSLIHWDFHNLPKKITTINYFYIDIWKLNITKLILINECFVVIYTYNSRFFFLRTLPFEWFFFVVVCFCYCKSDMSHWPLLWKHFL